MKNRILFIALIIITAFLYIPLNRSLSGGVTLDLPFDHWIPLWPAWVVPYLLCLPAWALGVWWVTRKTNDREFHAFACVYLFVNLFAAMIYFIYPTYVERPALSGSGWAFKLLSMVYQNDRVYNAFPSEHVSTTMLFCLFLSRWYPRWRGLWTLLFGIVVMSTLFTHQHYMLDAVGGSLLGWRAYYLGHVIIPLERLSPLRTRSENQ
jgi:membrane-associated phospholipid phosphatase